MKKFFVIIITLLLFHFFSFGEFYSTQQGFEFHVKWNYSVKKINQTEADLIITGTSDKDWHFYSLKDELNPIIFKFDKSNDYLLAGKVSEWPVPKKEYDDLMEANRSFYEKAGTFTQRIKINSTKEFDVTGTFEYQTCLLDGVCQMEHQKFKIHVPYFVTETSSADSAKTDTDKVAVIIPDSSVVKKTETDGEIVTTQENNDDFSNMSLWAFFLAAFGSGLIALMTPCIYPMIPMTISFFMHDTKSKRKSIIQALVYGLSIIIIYELIGTIVALTLGESFSNWLSTHWIPNIFFFTLFVVFAASFFGMFEITLPAWMINKSDKQADKGGYFGAFFMAFTLVLVSFSCTAPIAGAILAFSTQGMVIKPIVGMLGYSLAFAIPFTFFAIFPSALKTLPKSGGWLNAVKVVLGFIELALALKFLSVADQTYHWNILDREVYLSLWIAIFGLMGFYLLGKLKFSHDSDMKFLGVPRLLLAVVTFSFVVYMIPGLWGAPLKALTGWIPPMTTQDFDMTEIVRTNITNDNSNNSHEEFEKPKYNGSFELPHGLKGYFDYNQALAVAKKTNKPVFIDFTGHGCVNCRKMEEYVWVDPRILEKLRNDFVIVALYVDDHNVELEKTDWFNSSDGSIKKMMGEKNFSIQTEIYKSNGQPFYYLVDADGKKLVEPRGGYNPDIEAFLKFLEEGLVSFRNK